jgi:diguanylate cyclase (GGDEF)-like protein
MKKKRLLIFIKSRAVTAFLETFFRNAKKYRPIFCSSLPSFFDALSQGGHSAILTETALLPLISGKPSDIPVIIAIEGKRDKGIATAVAYKAEGYFVKPFLDKELDYTLQAVIRKGEALACLKREIHDLKTIIEFTQLISSTLDPKELLYLIVKKIADIMPVTRCSIIRIDWIHRYAYVVATFENPNISTIKLSLKKYPEIIEALLRKKPILIMDTTKDPIMRSVQNLIAPLGIRSILVMPIIFEEKVIGTLFLRTSRTNLSFTGNEIRLLQSISDAAANTLYNAFLFSQVEDEKTRLEKLAITDYLTGIYNIRYFYHRIIEEFSRAERYAMPISCLMVDIDFFKKINDAYGHKIGDMVLKEFALQLKKHTRKSDVLARYGGEEFIIMLPQTSLQGAVLEAERIRSAITLYKFKSLKNRSGITISIGISTFPNAKIKTHDELISSADDALYEAKNSGRDRVVVFT